MLARMQGDAPMELKAVQPALAGSYERLFRATGVPRFLPPLRRPGASVAVVDGLEQSRLKRGIGVLHRPEPESQSHPFDAVLSRQFDEVVRFDETRAVTPLKTEEIEEIEGTPQTYPFGL